MWSEWEGSNFRIPVPKTGGIPLAHTPILKSIFVFYTEKIKLLLDFVLTGICLFNYAKCILYNLLLDSKTGYREVFLPNTNLVFTGLEISASDSSTGTLSTSCSL